MTVASRAAGIVLVTVGAACLVPRTGQAHGSITTTVLFDREIVSLLERRCVSCHNEGGLSFPLSTYEQTWVKRLSMRTEVLRRHMPPWAAVPGYGEFANDNGLTPRESQFLVSWVEGLGPRNAGSTFLNVPAGGQAPAPVRASARAGAWQLGQPDIVRTLESITVPPSAEMVVQRATIDLRTDRTRSASAPSSSCPAIAAACARPGSGWNPRGSGWAAGRRGTASRSCRRAWPSSSPRARACRRNSTTAPGPIRSPTSARSGCFWLGSVGAAGRSRA